MKVKSIIAVQGIIFILLFVLLAGCIPGQATEEVTGAATASATIEPTPEPVDEEQIVNTPTPAPTATPEALTKFVEQVVDAAGLQQVTIFDLSINDWINLGISLLIIFISAIVVFRVVYFALERIVRATPTKYDDLYIKSIRTYLRAFIITVGAQYATGRLLFLAPFFKHWLAQLYFAIFVTIVAIAAWKLVDLMGFWYQEQTDTHGGRKDAAFLLTQRFLRGTILFLGLIVILDRFGVNVTALLAALGIGGLALSLGAQETLSNMISGLIILMDQPFMVGHRIEIQELGTWGDVVEIGMRSTRIRTRDNRLVIVPNATISANQVVNYSYPDPRYRVQMDIGIGYGQDIEKMRQNIIDTVRNVEGILPDKPVEALYSEMGASAMMFRVRWWIESFEDTRHVYDRVNTALQRALDDAGIDMPFDTYNINLIDDGPNIGSDAA